MNPAVHQAALDVNGCRLLGDTSGAVFWPDRRVLIVADLHLEKGTAQAARGHFLPPYDTRATLAALGHAIQRWRPKTVICLGDSFHDGEAAGRIAPADIETIRRLSTDRTWVWIAGNHDPVPPARFGGAVEREVTIGALVFRHEAKPPFGAGEISGHFHPKAAVTVRNKRLSNRCFVTDGRRLILPAFGAFTGWLDVLDPAIADLMPRGFTAHILGRRKVHAFPKARLSPWRATAAVIS